MRVIYNEREKIINDDMDRETVEAYRKRNEHEKEFQ